MAVNPYSQYGISDAAAWRRAPTTNILDDDYVEAPEPPPDLPLDLGAAFAPFPGLDGGAVQGTGQALTDEELAALQEDRRNEILVTGPNGETQYQYRGEDGSFHTVPYGMDPSEYEGMSAAEKLQAQMLGLTRETRDTNRDYVRWAQDTAAGAKRETDTAVDAMQASRLSGQQQLIDAARAGDQQAVAFLAQAGVNANQSDAQIMNALTGMFGGAYEADQRSVEGLRSAAGTADAARAQQLGMFAGGAGMFNDADQRLAGDLAQQARSYDFLEAADWGPDLQSQAARTVADPGAVAAQRAGLGAYGAVAGGSENLQSALAGARADEGAIGMQRAAGERLYDIASGGSDLQSAATGLRPDQEAVGAQRDFLDQYIAGSDPSLSATEKFMMEQARQEEEQDRRSFMGAKMRDLQSRGMLGSGEEYAAMIGAQGITSQNRMMSDLAALASAQQRAERQQAQGTGLASSMRASSFGEGLDVANAQDRFALDNRDASLGALGALAGLGSDMRGQSFSEAAARAGGTDAMATANRDVRLGALDSRTGLAGDMRGQSFSEGMQTGSAADAFAQFNREGSISQQNYNTLLQQQQQQAEWERIAAATGVQLGANQTGFGRLSDVNAAAGDATEAGYGRAGDVHTAERDATADTYTRAENLAGTALDANQTGYGRAEDIASAYGGANQAAYTRGSDLTSMQGEVAQDYNDRSRAGQEDLKDYTSLFTGQGTADTRGEVDALKISLGGAEAEKAKNELAGEEEFNITRPSTWI